MVPAFRLWAIRPRRCQKKTSIVRTPRKPWDWPVGRPPHRTRVGCWRWRRRGSTSRTAPTGRHRIKPAKFARFLPSSDPSQPKNVGTLTRTRVAGLKSRQSGIAPLNQRKGCLLGGAPAAITLRRNLYFPARVSRAAVVPQSMRWEITMDSLIYLVGLIVVVMFILSFFGLH
jgi:hypothetical protein